MEYRILGQLEVVRSGERVDLGGPKQRAVLGILLLDPNRVVAVDRIVDQLWAGTPPARAVGTLQAYVSNLRRALEPDRAPGTPAGALVTAPPGYVLRVEPDALDALRFERLAADGRRCISEGDLERGAGLLAHALGLWRGAALADLAAEPFAGAEAARLEELRLSVLEDRLEAELSLGRHTACVGDLEQLVSAHPLRERPRRQLMLALYRAGRQAEALRCYEAGRRLLAEELGIDPSPDMRALEQAILDHDPALAWEPPGEFPGPVVRRTAPRAGSPHAPPPSAGSASLVGRAAEVAELERSLADALAVLGHHVGDSRLMGGWPPRALCRR